MLNNTKYKLTHNKSLRIAYFGGSVTEGAGSSNASLYSYRALTTKWFKESYPDADITEIYAAIGGTGTSLGMYRCKKDVMDHKPDLVFVEFALNDYGDVFANVAPQTESIIRTMHAIDPTVDIVFLFSTGDMIIEYYSNSIAYESRDAQRRVAQYYGLPYIDMGDYMLAKILQDAEKPLSHYIPDGLHPCDEGYAVYFEAIKAKLSAWLFDESNNPNCVKGALIPAIMTIGSSDNAKIETFDNISNLQLNGFELKNGEALDPRFPVYAESTKVGDSFSFSFYGNHLALYWMAGGVSADVLVSIDGGEPIRCRSWDHYDRSFEKMRAAHVAKGLYLAEHTVTVTVAPNEGKDFFVRLAGIMTA
ncbi:MAG: SGNH/GDSL hydrolase family protein [Clostridia bacterium]|nr:SGNH/GDSL hydrolase family protein [Clostridia bacterium]